MIKRYRLLFLLFILISCSKVETGLNISITGFVRLYQEDGKELFNRANVTASVEDSAIVSQTNSDGKFTIDGLSAGKIYSVNIEKEGYGIVTRSGIQFVGNQEPGFIGINNLYQYPSILLKSCTLIYSNERINVTGLISQTDHYLVMCFVNDSADVSSSHYDFKSYGSNSMIPAQTYVMDNIQLNNTAYIAGTKLYVAVYFYNPYEPSSYDYNTHLSYYTSGKKAGVFNLIF